jgi:transcription antitermination factor NusG
MELALAQQKDTAESAVETATAWFALQVKSRWEKAVAASLRSKGYEEFLPLYCCRNRWSDRVKVVNLPLFPGYVFCRFEKGRRLPIVTTPGIVSVVGIGKDPQPVAPSEIEAIQALVASGLPVAPWPYLKTGDVVRVERGALEGVEGILTSLKNEFRVVLSITLLQRSVAVEIDRDFVSPISRRN